MQESRLQGGRAVLLGVVNRGEGCARGESMAIYARWVAGLHIC